MQVLIILVLVFCLYQSNMQVEGHGHKTIRTLGQGKKWLQLFTGLKETGGLARAWVVAFNGDPAYIY